MQRKKRARVRKNLKNVESGEKREDTHRKAKRRLYIEQGIRVEIKKRSVEKRLKERKKTKTTRVRS
jgi:hypothetical protein